MHCLTCEECDFMVHNTKFPGAVTHMFETCDERDAIFPSCEYDLGRIRSYKVVLIQKRDKK